MDPNETDLCPFPDVRRWNKATCVQNASTRHELVTARAILRLSHSVAQMCASNNSGFSAIRFNSRPRVSKQNSALQSSHKSAVPESFAAKCSADHGVHEDAHEKAITGSKRKWESDIHGTHVEMDVDQIVTGSSRPIQSSDTDAQHRMTTADSIFTLSDLVYQESCSSMHSASSSPSSPSNNGTSEPSSDENEADAEGDGDESGSHSRYASPGHSPFGFPGLRKSSNSVAIAIPQNRRISRTCRSSVCGGDSSDGISVTTKIPRLITGPGRSPDSYITLTPRRLERGSPCGGGKNGQRSLRSCNRGLRQHRLHLRCDKSDSMLVDSVDDVLGLCDRVHRNSVSTPSKPFNVCEEIESSSTSSSSCARDESPSRAHERRKSPESCEDLANDEQSDLPTDEFLPPCQTNYPIAPSSGSYRDAVMRPDRSTTHLRRHLASRHCPAFPDLVSAFPSGSPDMNEIDSEWEEIIQDTWPLLSHRARLDYLKGVPIAGSQCWKPSMATDPHRIDLMPSKLNEVQTDQSGPTFQVDHLAALKANNDHKMLLKLGWSPGTGLECFHHGILSTPSDA